jgi:DNA polymerase-3 subunit alpha
LFSLGDKGVCGWDFSKCNDARRVISKKKMDKLPILKQEIIEGATTPELGKYYWDHVVLPISSYAFSDPHALAYGMVAYQMAYIATKWDSLYWTTACLVVNSESLQIEDDDDEDDDSEQKKKNRGSDYGRIASAISRIRQNGVEVSLININTSDYGFKPDVINHRILYGLKPLSNINEEIVEQIKAGRPYTGIKDFMNRCPLGKKPMVNLIKAGAFDEVEKRLTSRKEIMAYYIYKVCGIKTKLNLQNWNGLVQNNLVPKDLEFQIRIYNFTKYIKAYCKNGEYYCFNEVCMQFFEKFFPDVLDKIETINGAFYMTQKNWDKIYQVQMDPARDWLKNNQSEILKQVNRITFKELWDKYAGGNYSHWEMESVCFYHGEHELAHIDCEKYNLSDFQNLQLNDIDYYLNRGQMSIPIYNLHRIAGTVLDKNDNKNYIVLLTTTGVVNVKLSRDQYAKYKKRISEIQPDGKKKVLEEGWFKRGRMLLFTGYKSDDITFRVKTYKNTMTHQIYLIEGIEKNELILRHERLKGIEEDCDD